MSIELHDEHGEYAELIARIRAQARGARKGWHSVGAAHTPKTWLGRGWLGEAMLQRLERAGRSHAGQCWANIMPPGSEYNAHTHAGAKEIAVWCLTDSGGSLFVEGVSVPDRAGQLVIFPAERLHWVPTVERERITVAANLD